MAKVALLIGVSEYGFGLNPLPGAVRAIETMQQVLQLPEMDGFDEVKLLLNPNPPVMREAIETLFSGRTNHDLILLFFSGHVIQDDSSNLYFTTSITCNTPRADLIRVSTIPASFVHDLMSSSLCQQQVVILDGCLSHLSAQGITANDDSTVDINTQLGSEGRSLLTCLSSIQNSCELEGCDHSVYTRYLAEGIRTGAADLDSDGWISVNELHEYASNKVQIAAPAIKPEFYPADIADKILLTKAPIDEAKLKYRKAAETWVKDGEIMQAGCYILEKLAESLQLTPEDCAAIEVQVLKPYQEYQEKLQRYQREYAKEISNDYPLGTQEREKLRNFQQSLGLTEEDVAPIAEQLALKLTNFSQSAENADELAQSEGGTHINSVPLRVSVVLPESTQEPALTPINPTPGSEDNTTELAQSENNSAANSVPVKRSAVLSESTSTPPIAPSQPTPAVNSSPDLASSQTSPSSVSSFPKKFLFLGMGGSLAALAVVIGIVTRTTVTPPAALADRETPINTDKKTSPSPSASPESKDCMLFVNGNLRSEPTPFQENVVASVKEALPVTGKQTVGGWIEVKLPNGKLAWAYRNVISNEEEMKACLSRKGITVKTIEDILPPERSSS